MQSATFIGGMWGTSNLALFQIDAQTGAILDRQSGPGVSRLPDKNFETVLFDLCEKWLAQDPQAKIVLSGMIGSSIGWVEAPYLDCPANAQDVAKHCVSVHARGHDIFIVPGLACENVFEQPDVMRGEETELLAWMSAEHDTKATRYVCIPGTHAKWVEIADHRIVRFFTSVTGEVYDVLNANGVLTNGSVATFANESPAFLDGVSQIKNRPEHLLNLLFSVRANIVCGQMAADSGSDYMSGLVIGADVASARRGLSLNANVQTIPVIGSSILAERYARVLNLWGISAKPVSASLLSAQGLFQIFTQFNG